MSIASEITRLQTAKAELKTAIEGKGVSVSSSAKLDDYAALVSSISQSGGSSSVGELTKYQKITNVIPSATNVLDVTHSLSAVPKLVIINIDTETESPNILEHIVLNQNVGGVTVGDGGVYGYAVVLSAPENTGNAVAFFSSSEVAVRRLGSSRYFSTENAYTVELYT